MLMLLLFVSDEFRKGKLSRESIKLRLQISRKFQFQDLTINFLTNADSDNHFEIGGGFILIGLFNYADPLALVTENVGYRFQRKNGGSFFTIAWTPIFLDWWYKWWYGISIGWTFKVP